MGTHGSPSRARFQPIPLSLMNLVGSLAPFGDSTGPFPRAHVLTPSPCRPQNGGTELHFASRNVTRTFPTSTYYCTYLVHCTQPEVGEVMGEDGGYAFLPHRESRLWLLPFKDFRSVAIARDLFFTAFAHTTPQ